MEEDLYYDIIVSFHLALPKADAEVDEVQASRYL